MASHLVGRVGHPICLDIVPPDAEVTVTEKTMSVKKEKVTIVGDEETRVTETSPQFTQQLFPVVNAAIGSNVKLECTVDGLPEPSVMWTFNGQQIQPSNRRLMTSTNQVCALTITQVGRMDAGEYICWASNSLGKNTTKCILKVGDQQQNGTAYVIGQPGTDQSSAAFNNIPIVPQMTPSAQSRPCGVLAPEVPPAPLTEPCAVIPLQPGSVPHMPVGAELTANINLDMGAATWQHTSVQGAAQASPAFHAQPDGGWQHTSVQGAAMASSAFHAQQDTTYRKTSMQTMHTSVESDRKISVQNVHGPVVNDRKISQSSHTSVQSAAYASPAFHAERGSNTWHQRPVRAQSAPSPLVRAPCPAVHTTWQPRQRAPSVGAPSPAVHMQQDVWKHTSVQGAAYASPAFHAEKGSAAPSPAVATRSLSVGAPSPVVATRSLSVGAPSSALHTQQDGWTHTSVQSAAYASQAFHSEKSSTTWQQRPAHQPGPSVRAPRPSVRPERSSTTWQPKPVRGTSPSMRAPSPSVTAERQPAHAASPARPAEPDSAWQHSSVQAAAYANPAFHAEKGTSSTFQHSTWQQSSVRAPSPSMRAPSPSMRAPSPTMRAPSPSVRAPSPTMRAPSPSRVEQNGGWKHSSVQGAAYASSAFQSSTYSAVQQQQIHTGHTTSTTSSQVRREVQSPVRTSRKVSPLRSGPSTPVHSGRTTPTFQSPAQEPPRFTMPLRDLNINDGDRVVFRVVFRGNPRPTVNWFFNSEPIIPSDDFQIKIDINRGESMLTIKEVFPDDEGEYMCKAESTLGAAITHCHLFVRLPSSSEEDIEKLVSQSTDTVRLQESLHLKERSSFSETISIDTQKRFKEFQMAFQIPDQKAERSEVIMRQQAALRGMKMDVNVELPTPRTQVQTTTMHLQKTVDVKAGQHKQLAHLNLPLQQQRRFSETIAIDHSKPQPDPVQVTFSLPEQRRRLEKSAIQIRQQAALRGMKMEVEIADSQRKTSQVEFQTKKHAEAVSTKRQEFHLQLEGAPPHFTVDLTSAKVMDGEEVKFNASVVGNPMPEVTWYKNGKVIVENPDFRTTYDKKTGVCSLHILEVFPQDTGEYRCIAVNQYGRAVTGATLQVDVFEYVQDSEEASASAAESLPDRVVSEDEAEFLERTQAFIANMQKLRQELQEEQVREEEVLMTEEYHEETVQMADVKWQIPKKAVTMEIELPEQMTGEENVIVELSQSVVEQAQRTHVMPLMEMLPPEVVEDSAERIPTPEGAGEEQVQVLMGQHEVEQAQGALVMPLMEMLPPEVVEESAERIPTPEGAGEEQVQVLMGQHEVEAAKGALAHTQEERLTEENIDDLLDRMPSPVETQEQEVVVPLDQPDVAGAKEHYTGMVEERHTPEEEEDMYFESAEPELQGEEVKVDLDIVYVQERKMQLTETQHAVIEVIQTGEAHAEYEEEDTRQEQVNVPLESAQKQLARPSLVTMQEQVVPPIQAEELNLPEVSEETSNEERVQVTLDMVASKAAQPSLVGHTQDVVDVQMTREDIEELHEQHSYGEQIKVQTDAAWKIHRPLQLAGPVAERVMPERIGTVIDDSIKEIRMMPTYVQPEYEPAVLEWFRLEIRVGPRSLEMEGDEMLQMEAVDAEEMSLQQLEQYQRDQQMLQESIEQTTQHLTWSAEAGAEARMQFGVQQVEQRMETGYDMMVASSESQVIRATQEVCEEREIITETTREEIEVIRRPVIEEHMEQEVTEHVRTEVTHEMTAPVFETLLSDITVVDGERAVFECKVAGTPRPEIHWYIDTVEIKISAEFRMEYTLEGHVTFIINDVLPEDEGEYMIRAMNDAGTCMSSAYLTVLPQGRSEPDSPDTQFAMAQQQMVNQTYQSEVDISMQTRTRMSMVEVPIPSQPESPRFIRMLESKEIFESMNITLECHVTGNPQPEIIWYKDGMVIQSSERIEIRYEMGICTLTIRTVTIEDEAEYMCEARNEYGMSSTVAELLVEKLLYAIEQVILEEIYEIQIEMLFKWRERRPPPEPPSYLAAISMKTALDLERYSPDTEMQLQGF